MYLDENYTVTRKSFFPGLAAYGWIDLNIINGVEYNPWVLIY